jgi:hypothetical protein
MTYHKKIRTLLHSSTRLCHAALLVFFIASCAPGTTGPSDPSSVPVGSGGSSTKQVDTSRSTKNLRSKDETLSINLFVVNNESSQELGDITIPSILDTQFLAVGPSQVDTAAIPFTAAFVIMNLQICAYPDTTVVNLPNGARVAVGWQNSNLISVIDYGTQD